MKKPNLQNSLMQYEHHAESSYRGSVRRRSFVQHDREECHNRMMKDYFIEQSTAIENLKCFSKAIEVIYGAIYLQKPNREDLNKLILKANKRGFPDMIRSLDCMHWEWKNCPITWAGQFKGRHNKLTIVLEAVASNDIWIWLAFFSTLGSNNNINVLWYFPLFDDVVNGWAPEWRYKCKEETIFSETRVLQERCGENVWDPTSLMGHYRGVAQLWNVEDLYSIMMTCIILHNVIVEDEYVKIEEDCDEDVDGDQPTYARAMARDVEYLAATTYETR
ncbi:uncharacterized protein [Malus domestica]|uniref:uncharacterized protein n=1 Tax=Malus domestica TaxID=3750 RepID=UPI0010AA28FD|nr:uncharacterized protein LOC114825850 [Malus domestica]